MTNYKIRENHLWEQGEEDEQEKQCPGLLSQMPREKIDIRGGHGQKSLVDSRSEKIGRTRII